ncbi:ABC transporter substrate-binding protein [Clostridium sp. 'deep sea']|uniref:ABC transporter substrate-binding protein n=1 Tax=Clostridium sp. 'deep sea' TaxID=2779445 RepID=UPI00189647E3|nr:ABC transporter substrate-binding protein [Clostridium sp. 'deep sea']QOR34051.1 ABC transporter substrate-binding protein [Clostridium sp. 'deep sea']
MTKIPFTKYATIIIIIITAIVTSACTANNTSSETKPLTVLQGVDATTLDPAMHSETPTGNIERQIYDTLLNQTSDMKIEPWLAKSYKMINETTWQFKLHENIKFHNGDQLTASDVKFSIDRILNKANKSSQLSNYSAISSVEVVDQYTVTIKTENPYPLLLTRLAGLRIVPEHYVKEVGNQQFALNPIGSGPYKLKEWVKDEYVALEANEDYWLGAAEIKELVFKPVPEAAARVMALQKGEADIIINLPPHQIASIEENKNTKIEEVASSRFIMLPFTTKNEVVNNKKVREAISYAIDVNSIIQNIFAGKATANTQPIASYDLGYNNNLKPLSYNPEKAKQLLKEAGYEKGIAITMGSPSGRYMMDKEVAEAIKAQLEEVGIKVKLTFTEWGNYVSQILAGTINYDLWLIGWGNSTFDAGSTLDFWVNSEHDTCYYRINEQVNNKINNLLNKALKTVDDEQREKAYQEIIKQVNNDIGFVNLYQQVDLYGVSSRLNWKARPDESIRLYEASFR